MAGPSRMGYFRLPAHRRHCRTHQRSRFLSFWASILPTKSPSYSSCLHQAKEISRPHRHRRVLAAVIAIYLVRRRRRQLAAAAPPDYPPNAIPPSTPLLKALPSSSPVSHLLAVASLKSLVLRVPHNARQVTSEPDGGTPMPMSRRTASMMKLLAGSLPAAALPRLPELTIYHRPYARFPSSPALAAGPLPAHVGIS